MDKNYLKFNHKIMYELYSIRYANKKRLALMLIIIHWYQFDIYVLRPLLCAFIHI